MPSQALITLLRQRNCALDRWTVQVERARRMGRGDLVTRWLLSGGLMHRPAVINACASGLQADLDRLDCDRETGSGASSGS